MNSEFEKQLEKWGPNSGHSTPEIAQAQQYCSQLSQSHYENFPVVTIFLPKRLRQHFHNVYAFCRWADDLGDEVGDSQRALSLLDWWSDELKDCFDGQYRHPVFVALSQTIDEFQIPKQPFEDLISAFEQDQSVLEYQTYDQLLDYCQRSANPVGRIVLYLCNSHVDENLQLSDSVCTGLQLANFWQDVERDLKIGRIYLPVEDMKKFGYSREELISKTTNEAFLDLMKFEVERAKQLLIAGLPLAKRMPGRLSLDIDLFAQGGLAVLAQIEKIGYRVLEQRPVLKKSDFAKLLAGSVFRSIFLK